MNTPKEPGAGLVLNWFIVDVVRLCEAREAVLKRGTMRLAHWRTGPGASTLIAHETIGVGIDAYDLCVFDVAPRELTDGQLGALRGLALSIRRYIEAAALAPPRDEAFARDHVAVALDYVTESFILLRNDWMIEHVNTQFERVVQRSRADVVGRNLWETFPEILGTRFETEARATMGGVLPRRFEEFDARLGRWFECKTYPCDQGLAILGIDITDAKTDERTRADVGQHLMQAQRMELLGTLASGIAHDFNNILGAILGHVGLLQQQPLDAQARESVDQIGIAGTRARDLVQRILAFSRSSAREFVRLPIRPMVEESLGLLKPTLPSSIALAATLSSEALCTTLNSSEVNQLVVNLCTNAWQAIGERRNGRIEVQLHEVEIEVGRQADVGMLAPGRHALLVVSDNGEGMDDATRVRLFEPFFTTKPRGQGTGLGLHVVQGIVTAHNGATVVRSAPGEGSSFSVYLPTAAGAEQRAEPQAEAPGRVGQGERVAYVDDDEVVLLMVARVLERAGFEVAPYPRPEAVLEALARDSDCFDLVVTDYNMPGMNGIDLAREVNRLCPHTPVIISSGYVSDELREAARGAGVCHLLNKEKTYEDLAGLATKALAEARQRPR